ncbi:phenoloxidase-activating factor 2-like [Coccinella septempunctata]|uniref:phenoloxidase-activating factor 2-like n=1 Tax=Coccinella septempunctata TaxID=41139 RepID=UPI001D0664D1|nr:phenoloxidase-activating factor 2-like [Coccinella septempunctata]
MPYWQCHENYTGLSDIVTEVADIRSFSSADSSSPISAFSCEDKFDVCCRVECGRRRPSNYAADIYGLGNYDLYERSAFSKIFQPRILGYQNEAEFGEFPWMLGILRNGAFQCGGSLIHPRVALTVAHCVYGKVGSFKIRAGEWDWQAENEDPPHQDRYVKMMVVHQQFDPITVKNDIALLIVEEPFKLSHSVGVACIPPSNVQYGKIECTATGWGKNSYYEGTYQTTLKKTVLPLIDRDTCTKALQQASLGPYFSLDPSFICAGGEENKDTCKGDGGSPLVCPIPNVEDRYEQVGIVSWGLKCGLRNTPGVYVNVATFSDWIDRQMEQLGFDTLIYRY